MFAMAWMHQLGRISSGSAVLKIAYTRIAGMAANPRPVNSEVAVSMPFTE